MKLMEKPLKDLLIIASFTLLTTFLIWLPHYLALPNFLGLNFSNGFATIYRNFDGLEYIVIAKSFYHPEIIKNIPLTLPANYYASHFPGLSLLILIFSPFFGFLKSMLFVSLLFTVFSAFSFYFLVKDFKLSSDPLFLTMIFLILPARWLIVRNVGSAEPVFAFFVIACLYFFLKFENTAKYSFLIWAAFFGLGAQIIRPPGVLLFISLALYIHYRLYLQTKVIGFVKTWTNHLKYFPFILMPIGLFGIFYLYSLTYGDFWAYFKSGDNIHLVFPPFQSLNKEQFWVGNIWLEDIVYVFIFGFLGGLMLIKQKLLPLAFFVLTYTIASAFVAHRDISRYMLPVAPFVIIAFEKILVSKEFKIVLIILSIAIYLYSQNFILYNTVPIQDLKPYN